ncbi:transcriptional regulator, partial [Bacteroides thetaiotaomicron]|nr:transcriptional regulator [Bacteroides thetaiotaomicron]
DKVIWVYNTDHVTRVDLDNDLTKAVRTKEYSAKDGFPVGRDMYIAKIEDRVYFATPRGIYKHNPHKDVMEPCPDMNNLLNGTAAYSRILEYHEPVPVIAYSMNSVRFDYALSFFAVGDDIRFQYRLNKGSWSDFTTVRTKEYSNLSECEYTFEVKAVFPDGTTSLDTIA